MDMKNFSLFLLMGFALLSCAKAQNKSAEKKIQTQGITEIRDAKERILSRAKNLLDAFADSSTVVKPFDSEGRTTWTNLPVGMVERKGVSIGNMTNVQRTRMHKLLSELLSSRGYLKTTGIMHLDNILERHFNIPDLKWSHKEYYFAFWGTPSRSTAWGFKLEGHHLSLNFTYADMSVAATPLFLGADPAEIRETEYAGWRVLGEEEDLGFLFLHSLDEEQRKKAILENRSVPRDILTNPDSEQRLTEFWGLRAGDLGTGQKKLLRNVIEEYLHNLEHDLAHEEMEKIEAAGFDAIYFAWIGKTEQSDSHYFLVHGPTFIIEFDNHRNHVHTIWRNKGNDFGKDILKDHLKNSPHHKN